MTRLSILASLCLCLGLAAQDARSFKELSQGEPGCPRVDDSSVGAHRQTGARPLMDAASDEVIAKGARRSAAAFGVLDIDGNLQTVGQMKGNIVAIGFWSTRCEPSMKLLQEFRNFQQQAAAKGMKIVLWPVHFEHWPEVMGFLRAKKQYFDGVQVKRLALGEHGLNILTDELNALPTVYLVDRDGNIAATWSGFHQNLLLQRINRLLIER